MQNKSSEQDYYLCIEEWFDEYWINYGSAKRLKNGKTQKITTIRDFLEFKGRTDLLKKIKQCK